MDNTKNDLGSNFESLKGKIYKDLKILHDNLKEFNPIFNTSYSHPLPLELKEPGKLTTEEQKTLEEQRKKRKEDSDKANLLYKTKITEAIKTFLKDTLSLLYLNHDKNKISIISKMDNSISEFLKNLKPEDSKKFKEEFFEILNNYYTNSEEERKIYYLIETFELFIKKTQISDEVDSEISKIIDNIVIENISNFLTLSKLSYNNEKKEYNLPNKIQENIIKDSLMIMLKTLTYNLYLSQDSYRDLN